MNALEAMKKALTGQKIKRMSKDEWMIATEGGSELRWFNNRQRVHLTIADILAHDWICEEDVVMVNRCQVQEGLKILKTEEDEFDPEKIERFFKHLGFKW